jgi:hypothetical protein
LNYLHEIEAIKESYQPGEKLTEYLLRIQANENVVMNGGFSHYNARVKVKYISNNFST